MSTYVRNKRTRNKKTLSGPARSPAPLDLLASRPIVRILRYLAAHPGAHTGRHLAIASGVASSRAVEALSRLVEVGALQRRRAGRAYLYSLNESSYLVSDILLPGFRAEARWLEALGTEVLTALDDIADTVILYGSWARGKAEPISDVDLLVVIRAAHTKAQAERALEPERGRLAERFGRPVSLLVVGRGEFRRRLRRGDRLIREIVREGRVVAGRSVAEVVGSA